jgi:hypothetical protein
MALLPAPGASPFGSAIALQRLGDCGALRARLRPGFLRSFSRGSRVSMPCCLSNGRRLGSMASSARANPKRDRPGLPGEATPLHLHRHVQLPLQPDQTQRLEQMVEILRAHEVVLDRLVVDNEDAGPACIQPDPGHGPLAPAHAFDIRSAFEGLKGDPFHRHSHPGSFPPWSSGERGLRAPLSGSTHSGSGLGCWAWCGCSGPA